MVDLTAAQKAARRAQESLYNGLCTVVEYQDITDEVSKISRQEEVTVIENQPCRLSFEKLNAVAQTETAAAISQGQKLFLAPEINIHDGSKIIVEQNGRTGEYSASGEPAVYPTHQEIMLELFKGWA